MSGSKLNFCIVERNQEDVDAETVELYRKIKPLLDEGCSVYRAVCIVCGVRYITSSNSWFQRL